MVDQPLLKSADKCQFIEHDLSLALVQSLDGGIHSHQVGVRLPGQVLMSGQIWRALQHRIKTIQPVHESNHVR